MQTEYNDRILAVLFQKYNITLEALFDYADAHHDEILDMDSIFNMETEEDARRFLVIPRLLDPVRADAIIALFREEEKSVAATEEPDTDRYALLLISAFAYNPVFFKMAVEWCVLMGRKAAQSRRSLPRPRDLPRHKPSPLRLHRYGYIAASPAFPQFAPLGESCSVEGGELAAYWRNQAGRHFVQFRFKPGADQKPAYVDVCFSAEADGVERVLRLVNEDDAGPGDTLFSEPVEADYTQGITVDPSRIAVCYPDGAGNG